MAPPSNIMSLDGRLLLTAEMRASHTHMLRTERTFSAIASGSIPSLVAIGLSRSGLHMSRCSQRCHITRCDVVDLHNACLYLWLARYRHPPTELSKHDLTQWSVRPMWWPCLCPPPAKTTARFVALPKAVTRESVAVTPESPFGVNVRDLASATSFLDRQLCGHTCCHAQL